MNLKNALTPFLCAACISPLPLMAATPGDLGTTLTSWGAEKAGNADHSIPAYTGGLTQPPAGFVPGSGVRPDPFPDDKPVLHITAQNMSQYQDNLTEGTQALLTRYPSMAVDVYPSRRSVAYPANVLESSRRNAGTAHLSASGLTVEGAKGGYPFPLPTNGNEVMWNLMLTYSGLAKEWNAQTWIVAPGQKPLLTMDQAVHSESPYYQGKQDSKFFSQTLSVTTSPARSAGQKTLIYSAFDPVNQGNLSWAYAPSQRRVRQSPDYVYDAPIPSAGGYMVIDDAQLFSGAMDRFDFKLVGKKDMFIPYNTYAAVYGCSPDKLLTPDVLNPQCLRWEKHRVWVVEANLKPGNRHIYSKRRFYLDEDSFSAGATENYDSAGKLYKVGYTLMAPAYDAPAPLAGTNLYYDLSAQTYVLYGYAGSTGGVRFVTPWAPRELSAQAMSATGVR